MAIPQPFNPSYTITYVIPNASPERGKDYYCRVHKVSSSKPLSLELHEALGRPATYLDIKPLGTGTINVKLNAGDTIPLNKDQLNDELEIRVNRENVKVYSLEITTSSSTGIDVWIFAS